MFENDEWGKWEIKGNGKILIEASQKWIDEFQNNSESIPEPIDEIELLQQKNLELEAQLSNLNESFISFMDLFIQMNPDLAT